jgi:hypothetical protein
MSEKKNKKRVSEKHTHTHTHTQGVMSLFAQLAARSSADSDHYEVCP